MTRRVEGAQGLIYVAAALLGVAAVFGVIKVLESGADGEAVSGKLIYTVAQVTLYLLVGLAGVVLIRRRQAIAWLGVITVVVAVAAFVILLWALWEGTPSIFSTGDSEASAVATLLALSLGPIALLLAWQRNGGVGAMLAYAASAALAAMATLAIVLVFFDDADINARVFGVLAIIYLLALELVPLAALSAWRDDDDDIGAASLELDHAVIAVSDRQAAIDFYTALLGAEVVAKPGGRIAFRLGDQLLNVHEAGGGAEPVAQVPVRPGNSDLCFVWPGSADSAVQLIREMGLAPVAGPVERLGARGPGRSVYCRDPDGSLIELISYPG